MKLSEFLASPEGRAKSRTAWAQQLGVSKGHFSEIASDAKRPSLDLAFRIERATGGAVPASSWTEVPSASGEAA